MKILFLSDGFPPNRLGGAEIVSFNLAKALKQKGYSTFVITTVQDRKNEEKVGFEGFTVFRIYSKYHERWRAYLSIYNPQTVGKVEKLIHEIKPDIVHAHNIHYHLSYHCLKIAKKYSKAVFLTAHDAMLFNYGKLVTYNYLKDFNYKTSWWDHLKQAKKRYNPFRNMLIRRYLRYVDKIFAVSDALKQALNNNGIRNVKVIHNGIDVDEWQIEKEKLDKFAEKFNLKNKKVVLFGGRLSYLKGGRHIIEAMTIVSMKVPEAALVVMGKEDGYGQMMKKLAKEKGIHLIITGWLDGDELKAAYWASDLVITSSIYFDPFPTMNLEAMACKKPVVTTCYGGSPEIVQNGITGYIVNPFDVELMAKKVIDLLKNPEKLERFGEAGYKRVKECFSLDYQVKKTIFWYQKMLSDRKKDLGNYQKSEIIS